jgi:hypothetical protein
VYFFQGRPTVHPEPVLLPDTDTDGAGVAIYGSVIHTDGLFRMWYQAIPRNWDGIDVGQVCYAESQDGINWTKPALNMVPGAAEPNNLVDLPFHGPSVCLDPEAPQDRRYRATGYGGYKVGDLQIAAKGYYTAHSGDGLHWQLDRDSPQWPGLDLMTSMYHPNRRKMIVAMKQPHRVGGRGRRAIWISEGDSGQWPQASAALVPDEFDDVCAMRQGFIGGDYYGMGMMPAGQGTVGFLWNFRHNLPLTSDWHNGVFGILDVSLVYQIGAQHRWLHVAGREPFLRCDDIPSERACRGMATASYAIEVGGEQWLYFGATPFSHGWYLDDHWQLLELRRSQMIAETIEAIYLVRWPKDRLFGFRADPEGSLRIDLGEVSQPCELTLNFKTHSQGSIRVEIPELQGYGLKEAVPLTGDSLSGKVTWKGTATLGPLPAEEAKVQIHMERAEVYAYDLAPLTA